MIMPEARERERVRMSNSKMRRIESYDAFRGVCAMGILFSHMSYLSEASNPVWKEIYDHFMRYGSRCSSFFFIVSGFMLAYTWKGEGFGAFITKKLRRLYPLTLLVFILAIGCSFILNDTVNGDMAIGSPLWLLSIVLNIVPLKAFVPLESVFYSFHGPSWYVSVLLVLYVAGYFLVKNLKSNANAEGGIKFGGGYGTVCIIAYLVQFILCIAVDSSKDESFLALNRLYLTYVNPYFRIFGEGLFGIVLCQNMEQIQEVISRKKWNRNVLEITAAIVFIGFFFLNNIIKSSAWGACVWFVPVGFLIVAFYEDAGIVSSKLKKQFWQFLGDISFEVYMTHAFVYEGLPVIFGIVGSLVGYDLKAWIIYHAGTRFAITLVLCIVFAEFVKLAMSKKERNKALKLLKK